MPYKFEETHCFIVLALLSAVLVAIIDAPTAHAACNLRPVAKVAHLSNMGGADDPLTTAGRKVQLQVNPACDGSAGFEPVPMDNTVIVRFEPPTGAGTTDVAVDGGTIAVGDCTLPGGRCRELSFTAPDTTALLPPNGLAGPSRILVEDSGAGLVAEIGELYQPTKGCDRQPEMIFRKFTVLPAATNFSDLANGIVTEVLATVDGGNNLLVPLDYWGGGTKAVLAETPGAPVAIFLEGQADVPALGAGDATTLPQALAAQIDPSRFVRSFTFDGRPLPPLLRVTSNGGLFGTADAVESVLRVARNDGAGGGNIHDFTDRLASGKGPIVLGSVTADVNDPVSLASLRSVDASIAYAREEAREGVNLNVASGDGDLADFVVQVASSDDGTTTNTGRAVQQLQAPGGFAVSAIAASKDAIAFLESERSQASTDLNGDGDIEDAVLRVFDRAGAEIAVSTQLDAATSPLIDSNALSIAGNRAFVRTPGAVIGQPAACCGPQWDPEVLVDWTVRHSGHVAYALTANGLTGGSLWTYLLEPDGSIQAQLTPIVLPLATPLIDVEASPVAATNSNIYVLELQGIHRYTDNGGGSVSFANSYALGGAIAMAVSPVNGYVFVYEIAYSDPPAATTPALLSFDSDLNLLGALPLPVAPSTVAAFEELWVGTSESTLHAIVDDSFGTAKARCEFQIDGSGILSGGSTCSNAAITLTDGSSPKDIVVAPDDIVYMLGDSVIDSTPGLVGFESFSPDAMTDPRFVQVDQLAVGGAGPDLSSGYYLFGTALNHVAVFKRIAGSGKLIPLSILEFKNSGSFNGTGVVAVHPDDKNVYVEDFGPGGIFVLNTEAQLAVVETDTGTVRSEQPLANRVVTSPSGLALVFTPERVTLNGSDSDISDDVAQILDTTGPSDVLTSLGTAASRGAISDTLVVLAVPEGDQGGNDLNFDGDATDEVLQVLTFPGLSFAGGGQAVDAVGIVSDKVVIITPEANEDFTDLNGDFDTNDRVIRIWDTGTSSMTEIGLAADEFVTGGSLVAFRSPEAAFDPGVDMIDLNDDGDLLDSVMFVYDTATDTLINTQLAATPCVLPGCELGTPYKIQGKTVSFLTDEVEQNDDLNGDGDMIDIVLSVFNVASVTNQLLDTTINDATMPGAVAPETPVFPQESLGGTLLLAETKESEIGVDINADGFIDDAVVVLVAGDSDGDGTFDEFDTCPEQANSGQSDADGDGLGDAGCDPSPVACPDTPLVGCKAPATAKGQLKIKDKGDPAKRSLKWKWGNGDETLLAELGDPTAAEPVYSFCVYDDGGAGAPIIGAGVPPVGDCDGKPCWKAQSDKGFKYKNRSGTAGGVQRLQLRAGAAGKAKVQVKAKGANLVLPTLPLTPVVTGQLIKNEGSEQECWSATFSAAQKNDSVQFKAKSD